MNSSSTPPRPYGQGQAAQTPLYVQLIAEWRARGAMLPGTRDLEWDRLASSWAFEEETQRTLRMLRLERDPVAPSGGLKADPDAVGRVPRPR
ncbi:hypothetical protein ABZ611_24195 [Streptomyces sp. NPDC007861]|uniref:hypothetical protein n=1 Tax=Streptomyces sp. NPDC007861 TaxID=3154893 RepID=UPI0034015372